MSSRFSERKRDWIRRSLLRTFGDDPGHFVYFTTPVWLVAVRVVLILAMWFLVLSAHAPIAEWFQALFFFLQLARVFLIDVPEFDWFRSAAFLLILATTLPTALRLLGREWRALFSALVLPGNPRRVYVIQSDVFSRKVHAFANSDIQVSIEEGILGRFFSLATVRLHAQDLKVELRLLFKGRMAATQILRARESR